MAVWTNEINYNANVTIDNSSSFKYKSNLIDNVAVKKQRWNFTKEQQRFCEYINGWIQ